MTAETEPSPAEATETVEPLSPAWVDHIVGASDDPSIRAGRSGVVTLKIGKTRSATLSIVDGRVVGSTDVEAATTIPFTAKQLAAVIDGSESLAQAFIRGDIKPEGATGPLVALIELFEDPTFKRQLAERF